MNRNRCRKIKREVKRDDEHNQFNEHRNKAATTGHRVELVTE